MASGSTYDIFLVLKPYRRAAVNLRLRSEELDDAGIESVQAFYDPDAKTGLIALRYRRDLLEDRRALVRTIAAMGLPLVVPDELAFDQRCRFYLEHLPQYSVTVQQFPSDADDTHLVHGLLDSLDAHVGQAVSDSDRDYHQLKDALLERGIRPPTHAPVFPRSGKSAA